MDSEQLHTIYDEVYMPSVPKVEAPTIPSVAPSLIMQDRNTDTTHHLACGCCPNACIHQRAWWGPEVPHVRPSLVSARSSSSLPLDNSD